MTDCRVHITARPTNIMLEEIAMFQETCASRAVHQSLVWPYLNRPETNQEYMHFIAKLGPRTLSAGLIRLKRVAAGFTVASIQRGPVTVAPEDAKIVLLALEEKLLEMGVITLSVNPNWTGADGEASFLALSEAGFRRVNRDLQFFPTATALIDTTRSRDEIFSAMTDAGRKHLQKASDEGATCRPMANREEALRANEIMVGMAAENGLILDSQHNFTVHFEHLQEDPAAGSIIVTELNGVIFGAAVNYLEGDRGYNILLTTSTEVNVPPAHLLMWHSIQSMKMLGAKHFDMAGFPDDSLETDESMRSRGAFKEGFGPKIVKLTPTMSKPLRPMLHGAVTKIRGVRRNRKVAKAASGGSSH